MNIDDAIIALELLWPAVAIPMHYNTVDKIRQDPADFARRGEGPGVDRRVLKPGEMTTLR